MLLRFLQQGPAGRRMLQVLLGIFVLALPDLTGAAEPLGCYHYGYAYTHQMLNITGNPFVKDSAYACQQQCRVTKGCWHFGFYQQNGYCYLGGPDGRLRAASKGAISGPAYCYQVSQGCTGLPDANFPGDTPEQSMKAWPNGEQPSSLQCWPRRDDGLPMRCRNKTAIVLEDTETGWPGQCEDMLKVTDLKDGETCQLRCMMAPLCSVWSVETSSDTSGKPTCWIGMLGTKCYKTTGIKPVRAQRIQHGTYRELITLMGVQVLGLVNTFEATVYPSWEEGAKHCEFECRSFLLCQFWQYSETYGCYIEDPRKHKVTYPFTYGGLTPSATKTSSLASDIVRGGMIQHNCVGPMSPIPAAARDAGVQEIVVPDGYGTAGQSEGWPFWINALIFLAVVLCLSVVGAAVWMGIEDNKRRSGRNKGITGAFGQGQSSSRSDYEQAGLLHGMHMPTMQNVHMPHMPNIGLPWPGQNQGQQSYHGVPGYGDGSSGHAAAHQGTHGGRYF
eukprot:gb/GFBE01049949.1/.p1 GENE.gb/GFBE01049949.1/~~gb/GFBE01049949.1/.p1  ORF type:complete len:502 (+),score=84.69 gb/GFBE01049949.1/:1-1506(+)